MTTCPKCGTKIKITTCQRCGVPLYYCPKCTPIFLCIGCRDIGGGWYTPATAAAYLQEAGKTADKTVSIRTIYRWYHAGKLEGERWGSGNGGGIHFSREALDAFEPLTPNARTGPAPKEAYVEVVDSYHGDNDPWRPTP